MLRLLHGADFHLDSAFGALPAEKARQRRQESRDVVERLCALARERQADALLLPGDLFDGQQLYRETAQALARLLGEVQIPVFIAPGNHDPYGQRSPYTQVDWPGNVHIFHGGEIESVDCGSFVVHGAAFCSEGSPGLLRGFSAPADGKLHLMVLHGDTENKNSTYSPITREEIADSGLTYLALGHLHQCSGLLQAGKTAYAYPGCPEGRGFDELGEKGALLVEIEDERVKAEFLPLCRRRYEILRVDVTGQEPLTAIRQALPPQHQADLYRIVLQGEAESVSLQRLALQLEGEFFYLELQDETRLPLDLWAREGEDSLRGLFLQEMRRRSQTADPGERRQVEQAVRFALSAMEHRDL